MILDQQNLTIVKENNDCRRKCLDEMCQYTNIKLDIILSELRLLYGNIQVEK